MKEYIYRESTTRDGVIINNRVTEIIRCKCCMYFDDKNNGTIKNRCIYHNHEVNQEDFCSYGNRKLSS